MACGRRSRTNAISIEALGQGSYIDRCIHFKSNTFSLHHLYTAVNHRFLQLKVRNTKTQQTTHIFVLFKHGYIISTMIKLICSSQTCRTRTYHSHTFTIASKSTGLNISLAEGSLNNGTFILANRNRSIH